MNQGDAPWQVATLDAEMAKIAEVSSGEEAKADPGNLDLILLNNQGYKKKRKGPVEFTHKKHVYQYKLFCWDCHHDYKDGQNVWVPWGETKRCNQCHDPKSKEHNKIMLQKAFHYQCKGCHKDLAKKKDEDRCLQEMRGLPFEEGKELGFQTSRAEI